MTQIKCSTCNRLVEVKPDYYLKTCPNCLIKKKAKGIVNREFNMESRKQIKELKFDKGQLPLIFKNYTTYANNYRKLFKSTPTFDDYIEALRNEKLELAHKKAEKLKREKRKKSTKFIDEDWGTDLNIEFDRNREDLGISRQSNRPKPQIIKETDTIQGSNLWGSESNYNKPKPKSIQDLFKQEFGSHSE